MQLCKKIRVVIFFKKGRKNGKPKLIVRFTKKKLKKKIKKKAEKNFEKKERENLWRVINRPLSPIVNTEKIIFNHFPIPL